MLHVRTSGGVRSTPAAASIPEAAAAAASGCMSHQLLSRQGKPTASAAAAAVPVNSDVTGLAALLGSEAAAGAAAV